MKNLANMMKQAQELQSKMSEMRDKVDSIEVKGESAGGMCEVMMSGKGQVNSLKIDPSLFKEENVHVLEDLMLAAFNDAKEKTDRLVQEKMSELTGGIPLPAGFQLPF